MPSFSPISHSFFALRFLSPLRSLSECTISTLLCSYWPSGFRLTGKSLPYPSPLPPLFLPLATPYVCRILPFPYPVLFFPFYHLSDIYLCVLRPPVWNLSFPHGCDSWSPYLPFLLSHETYSGTLHDIGLDYSILLL